MPFQPINFASIPPLAYRKRPGASEWIDKLASGFKVGQMPAHMKRESEKEQLANKLMQLKADYLPRTMESQMALRAAQAGKARQEGNRQQMLGQLLSQLTGAASSGLLSPSMAQTLPSDGSRDSSLPPLARGRKGPTQFPNEFAQAYARKQYGVPVEFPSEKSARDLADFTSKEKLKRELTFQSPTRTTQTREEKIIAVAPHLFESLEKLMDMSRFNPSRAPVATSVGESFATAKNFPRGEGTTKMAIEMLHPTRFETPTMYKARIRNELEALAPDMARLYRARGKKVPAQIKKYLQKEKGERIQERRTLHGFKYYKEGGKWRHD